MNRIRKEILDAIFDGCGVMVTLWLIVVILSVVVGLFSSCSSKKHIVIDEKETQSQYERMNLDISKVTHENGDIQRHIIIYDTSLPIDIETGKRPVKKEIKEEIKVKLDSEEDNKVIGESNVYVVKETNIDEKKELNNRNLSRFCFVIVLFSIFCISFYLFRRIRG